MHGTQGLPGNRRSSSEAAILDAAWAQFARAGPDGVSLRDVARDAGCSHTLLGRYFGSKDGLVDAVADRFTLAVATTVDATAASRRTPLTRPNPVAATTKSSKVSQPSNNDDAP